jgi:hypothetical protein
MSILRYFLPLMLVAAIGCGDGRVHLPTAPVVGTVTYQGKPLGGGRIIFFHPSGQAAGADIAANGAFELAAFQGPNQVAIECFAPERLGALPEGRATLQRGKSLIPDRYTEISTSGLKFEVTPGEKNKAEFSLTD